MMRTTLSQSSKSRHEDLEPHNKNENTNIYFYLDSRPRIDLRYTFKSNPKISNNPLMVNTPYLVQNNNSQITCAFFSSQNLDKSVIYYDLSPNKHSLNEDHFSVSTLGPL